MTTPQDPWQEEPTQIVDGGATQRLGPQEQTTVWQPQQQQSWEEQQRAVPPPAQLEPVGKHVLIAVAIVVAVALVGVAVFFTVQHNGSSAAAPPPSSSSPAPAPPPAATTTTTEAPTTETTTSTVEGPLGDLASAPLSTSSATMAPATCALPRFDLPDAKQAQFFTAAKKCADAVWGATLPGMGPVQLVTVTKAVQTTCGAINPTDPPKECAGTVYMTPAYLRDVQGNGRYPGKYFGTFLREYGHGLQDASGLTALYEKAKTEPGADSTELGNRYEDQAICLAGVASGAMAGRGAVDGNITNEIRSRITSGEPAPGDAGVWLEKGFSTKTVSSCNTWSD